MPKTFQVQSADDTLQRLHSLIVANTAYFQGLAINLHKGGWQIQIRTNKASNDPDIVLECSNFDPIITDLIQRGFLTRATGRAASALAGVQSEAIVRHFRQQEKQKKDKAEADKKEWRRFWIPIIVSIGIGLLTIAGSIVAAYLTAKWTIKP